MVESTISSGQHGKAYAKTTVTSTVNQQETRIRGSSEIVCRQTHGSHSDKPQNCGIDENFLIWFIGFVEGDGSFVVGKRGLSFEITQSYYDIDLLHNIAQAL